MKELVKETVTEFISIKNRINELNVTVEAFGYENARQEHPELVNELEELLGTEHQYASLENLTEILNSEEKTAALAILTEMAVCSCLASHQENELFRYEINKKQLAKEIVSEILSGMFNPSFSDEAVKFVSKKRKDSIVEEVSKEPVTPAKKGFGAFLKKIF